jgi:hypothetical protein
MKRIVYLIHQPLDEWNYGRFGIQTWIDRGWDVEVWDLTPLVHPGIWRDFIESKRKLHKFAGYFPVAEKSELDTKLSQGGKIGYFIDFAGDDYDSIRVKMSLVRSGAIRVRCSTGLLPVHSQRDLGSRFRRLFAKGPLQGFKRLTEALARRFAGLFIRPGLVIVSGQRSNQPVGCETVRAHNLDYDIYLGLKSMEAPAEEYAVFLDQDLCHHSDYIREGWPFSVTPSKYFPAVRKGLKAVSGHWKLGLRIAAHPRASYRQGDPDCFGEIPIECGKTAELIRNCKLVVCHNSTAAQFAVLFRKPLLFATTDELAATPDGKNIVEFASVLGKSVINFDGNLDGVDWQEEVRIDEQKYDAYRNEYIKIDGSPEAPFWEIVINHLEQVA